MNHADYGPIGLLVIQATSLCNLDCSYCYLPDRQKRRIFDLNQLTVLLNRVYESPFWGPHLSILWHAGEPLTLPCSFYDEASAILREQTAELQEQGVQIEQHVQTNATLINDAWCECFKRNQIVVGVSVDGPEEIHDSHRRFRNGKGSHALTMRGIRKLQDHSIPIHAIAVLTSAAMEDPERMYSFFHDNGIHDLGFNVEEQEGVNASSSMQGLSREKQYHNFLKCFWECNQRDGFPIRLREFDQITEMMAGGQRLL
ncbi:MAG: cyclophane-forming radical SAM/SPASM peptide maturase GrrM/OscB, partial [Synechococcus sp. ChBW.bin.23]